jgi:transcriptional regulator with XRE-family HTH domain
MKLGERLRELRKEKKLSLRKLSEITKISHTYIADIEKGVLNGSYDTLEKLINSLADSEEKRKELYRLRDWENTPESIKKEFEYLKHANNNQPVIKIDGDLKVKNTDISVPIYDNVVRKGHTTVFKDYIGDGHHYGTLDAYYDDNDSYTIDENNHNFIGLKMKDKSMEPMIPEGATVYIEQSRYPDNQKIGFFYIDNKFLIRKIISYGEITILRASNNDFEDIEVDKFNDFEVLGKVVSSVTTY